MTLTLKILFQITKFITIILPLTIIGWFLVPIGLLFRLNDTRHGFSPDLKSQRLPKLLKWFDVGDERDQKYGLNGDLGYQCEQYKKISGSLVYKNSSIYNHIFTGGQLDFTKWQLYRLRCKWLAFRNPLNAFKYTIMGYKVQYDEQYSVYHRQSANGLEVTDWANGESGSFYCELNTGVWEYYLVYQYPFKKDKCLRVRMGHKVGQFFEESLQDGTVRSTLSWACTLQPWKTYRGKTKW